MSLEKWTEVITRINPRAPIQLDDVLMPLDPRSTKSGTYTFPAHVTETPVVTPFLRETTICLGARITEKTTNRLALAMKLAQMAADKDAMPIIISHVEYSGLERFGFRVERVAGETEEERAAAEQQIIDFWNILMVV